MAAVEDPFDFEIPSNYKGKEISIRSVSLYIPEDAVYLIVNPLENEEEFLGFQGDSDRQELVYYADSRKAVKIVDLDGKIRTSDLMYGLEQVFKKLY